MNAFATLFLRFSVIQFGFVTLFVSAFPIAPLFALINNILEIRLDAYKFLVILQRPAAYRAMDIGAWFDILRWVSCIAVLSNVRYCYVSVYCNRISLIAHQSYITVQCFCVAGFYHRFDIRVRTEDGLLLAPQ